MTLMTLGFGAEVDLATGDELRTLGDDLTGKILGKTDPKPIYIPRVATVVGAGVIATLDLGSPPVGRIWSILGVTVCGIDDHTSGTGTVAIYCGNPYTAGLSSLRIPGLAIPSFTTLSENVLWCHASENLFAVTSGPLMAPNPVTVTALLAEWRESDITQKSGRP